MPLLVSQGEEDMKSRKTESLLPSKFTGLRKK